MTFLPAPAPSLATPPRVAFAVPRKVGTAVTRNRVRRVIRAHLGSLQCHPETSLAPGAYLVAVSASQSGADTGRLVTEVDRCLDRLRAVKA